MTNEFDEDAFLDALGERAHRMAASAFFKERILEHTDTCCLDSLEDAPECIPRWIGEIQGTAEALADDEGGALAEGEDPKARRKALWRIAAAAIAALAMDAALRDGAEAEDVELTIEEKVEEKVERDSDFFARNVLILAPIYLGEKERTFASPEGTKERAFEEEISGKVEKQILGWWDEYKAEHVGQPDQEIRAGFDPWLQAKAKELGVVKAKKRYEALTWVDDASKYKKVELETADPDTLRRCAEAYQGFLDLASGPDSRAKLLGEMRGGEPELEELASTVRERLARCQELLVAASP